MSSSSSTATSRVDLYNVKCRCGSMAPLRTAFGVPNVGRRFLACVNYEKEHLRCGFFEWVDLPTCDRGNEFGDWIVKKNTELENEIVLLRGKIRELQDKEQRFGVEWKKKEQWYDLKIKCMTREMKGMEVGFEKRKMEWTDKDACIELNELEMEELRLQMEELRVEMARLRVKLEEEEAKNEQLGMSLGEVQPKNARLRMRMKEMEEVVDFEKWVVKLLIAVVVGLIGVVVVLVLAGTRTLKNKKNMAILP